MVQRPGRPGFRHTFARSVLTISSAVVTLLVFAALFSAVTNQTPRMERQLTRTLAPRLCGAQEAAKRLTLQQALLAELQYTTKADVVRAAHRPQPVWERSVFAVASLSLRGGARRQVSLDGMEEEYEPQDVELPSPKPREKRRVTPAGGPVETEKAKAAAGATEPRRDGVAEGDVGGEASSSERQQWASERAGVQEEGARAAPGEGRVAAGFAQAELAEEEDVVLQDGGSVRIRTEGASTLEGELEQRAEGMAAAIQGARPATTEAATTTEAAEREGWFDIMQFGAVGDGLHNDTVRTGMVGFCWSCLGAPGVQLFCRVDVAISLPSPSANQHTTCLVVVPGGLGGFCAGGDGTCAGRVSGERWRHGAPAGGAAVPHVAFRDHALARARADRRRHRVPRAAGAVGRAADPAAHANAHGGSGTGGRRVHPRGVRRGRQKSECVSSTVRTILGLRIGSAAHV